MDKNLDIRLYSDVYYKQYEDGCYIWKTSKEKFVLYDNTLTDILDNIGYNFTTIESMLNKLDELYELDGNINNIMCLLQKLVDDEIVEVSILEDEDNVNYEIEDYTAEKNILYSVLFELTYSCNERCKHCYVDYQDNRAELDTHEIFNIIDQLAEANVSNVVFSGGDIFTRKDTLDIIEYTVSKRLLVDVYTNGLALNDESVFRLAKLHLRSIQCSVYGSNSLIHDSITTIKGSFNKTIDILKKLKLCGTPVGMKVVLMKDNINDFENIRRLSMKLGIPAQFSSSIRPTLQGKTDNSCLRINEKDIRKFIKIQYKNKEKKVEDVDVNKERICRAGFNSLNINPFGDVYICSSLGRSIGNLKDFSIQDIWNKSKQLNEWRKYRQKDLEDCAKCNLLTYCHFCPAQAFMETGKWYKRYQEACIYAQCNYDVLNKKC